MEWMVPVVGLGIIGLGAAIWQFEWIHLLGNVKANEVDSNQKSVLARFAGLCIMSIGGIILLLGVLIPTAATEQQELTIIFMGVVGIFAITAFYLARLNQ